MSPLSAIKRMVFGVSHNLKTSIEGVVFIQSFEGFSFDSYLCPAGKWTIGWGSTRGITKDMTVTREAATRMFLDDLKNCENDVKELVKVRLSQCQFDALVSFVYNCGPTSLRVSTLLKALNTGDYVSVPLQLARWVKIKDKFGNHVASAGLIRRRKAEGAIFSNGIYK